MMTSIKVRLEPNNKQKSKLFQASKAARFIYNWTLARQEENYKNGGKFISDNDLRKEITKLKKTEQYRWLNTVSNNIAKQAVKMVAKPIRSFLKGYLKNQDLRAEGSQNLLSIMIQIKLSSQKTMFN